MPDIEIVRFDAAEAAHVEGVEAVCRALGWPSYSDPAIVARGYAAPGVTTVVARGEPEGVLGFAQVFGDGVVQGYLAQLGVLPSQRRQGIATALVEAAFAASGVKRLDLVTDDADAFYPHRLKQGYRLYPG